MIDLLLLNNFYPVISYRRVEKESDELSYTGRSLVMVRSQRKGLTEKSSEQRLLFVSVRRGAGKGVLFFLFFLFFFFPLLFLSREFARRNLVGRGVLSFPFTGLTRELKVLPWLQGRCHGLESARRREREREREDGCASLRTVPLFLSLLVSLSRTLVSIRLWLPDVVSSTQTQNRAKR